MKDEAITKMLCCWIHQRSGAPVHERVRVHIRADYIKSLISACCLRASSIRQEDGRGMGKCQSTDFPFVPVLLLSVDTCHSGSCAVIFLLGLLLKNFSGILCVSTAGTKI